MKNKSGIAGARLLPVFLFAFLILLHSSASSQNLVVNSGFTNGLTGWSTNCTTELNPENVYGGSSTTNYVTEIDVERCIHQQVCIMSGASYRFTYKGSRRTQPQTLPTVGLTLKVSGVQTGTDYINVSHTYTNTVWGYTEYNFDFSIPSGSSEKQVIISFTNYNNTGTYGVLIDDITLVLGGTSNDSLSIASQDIAAINTPVNFALLNGSTDASYLWNFGANATSPTSSDKDPNNIQWSTIGDKVVTASVSNGLCTVATLSKTIALSAVTSIKINNFSGANKMNEILLNWNAENENGQAGKFVIEKQNGTKFDSIGVVNATEVSGIIKYSFVDIKPFDGSNTYRIKVIGNKTGTYYSMHVNVNFEYNVAVSAIKGYPNPAQTTINVSVRSNNEFPCFLQVIGFNGVTHISRPVHLLNGLNLVQLDVSSLPQGNFIIKLTSSNQNFPPFPFRKS